MITLGAPRDADPPNLLVKPPNVMSEAPFAVVIVEDSPEDLAEVRRLLLLGSSLRRFTFTAAATGAAGIAACLGGTDGLPDCVILDYYLPDMNAPEVLAALHAGGPLTVCPVLVLTGSAERQCGPDMLRAGAQDYLNKAWLNPEILARAVDNAVERHRMARLAQEREAALRRSDERLRLALEASDTGLWTHDLATGAVSWSPECYRIYGRAEGDLAESWEAYLQMVHEDDRAGILAAARTATAERGPYESEFRVVRPSGEVVWVASRGRATYAADGRPISRLGTVTDISRRKRAEEALLDADRRKDEFLATLAHELRNPLAPLRMGLGLLARIPSGQDFTRLRVMMERQLGHLVRLIDDLLDVSRIRSGKMELARERTEVRAVVEAALEISRPLVDAAGHTLTVSLPEAPLVVHGDPTRLAQALSNLVNNAARYTPPGGRIEITVDACGDEVRLRVADNGCGIPRAMLFRVFDMFTQVDRTLTRTQGGLGIGLSLVRQLVEMHGGQVTAESPGPGLGSTFTLRLPLALPPSLAPSLATDASATAEPPSSRPTPSGRMRRVRVIDDNVDAADTLVEMLRLFGHEALAVHDGTAAFAAVRGRPPEVVLLDIGLPGMDGYEIARRLRADPHLEGAVLVALTGWGNEEARQRSYDAGFDHHLTKPADPSAVNELLARLPPALGG